MPKGPSGASSFGKEMFDPNGPWAALKPSTVNDFFRPSSSASPGQPMDTRSGWLPPGQSMIPGQPWSPGQPFPPPPGGNPQDPNQLSKTSNSNISMLNSVFNGANGSPATPGTPVSNPQQETSVFSKAYA